MSFSTHPEGRATLARSYRNLTVRQIRARLEGSLGEAERATAQAELLRRGADDGGPDTTFATGFAPTGDFDVGEVHSEPPTGMSNQAGGGAAALPTARRRWPVLALLVLMIAGALGWAIQARLIHLG
jgi:hypothetical protein